MSRLPLVFLTISLPFLMLVAPVNSQQAQISARPNPQIEKIIVGISAENIETTIRKLVSFGTRHTLSSQDDPVRGIGAARRWIKSEFERFSRESGGRLVVAGPARRRQQERYGERGGEPSDRGATHGVTLGRVLGDRPVSRPIAHKVNDR